MSENDVAKRLLSDGKSCYNCVYNVDGKCDISGINDFPDSLLCDGYTKFHKGIKTYPVKVKARKMNVQWTQESMDILSLSPESSLVNQALEDMTWTKTNNPYILSEMMGRVDEEKGK